MSSVSPCTSSEAEPVYQKYDREANKFRNIGSWTVEYHYGNATDTTDFERSIATYEDAVEIALSFFIADGPDHSKYCYPESQREWARAHLFRFGYVGDGSRHYDARGLTRVEIYFEPRVKFENDGKPLVETQNQEEEETQ